MRDLYIIEYTRRSWVQCLVVEHEMVSRKFGLARRTPKERDCDY